MSQSQWHKIFISNDLKSSVLCEKTFDAVKLEDNEDTVLSRLGAYHDQTSPLADWYDSAGIFHRINGDRAIDDITADILSALQ